MTTLLQRTFPNPAFAGWRIVLLCFIAAMLSSPGQSFVIALYVESLMAELGLTRVELSSLYAGMTLLAAASLPTLGAMADRARGGRFLALVLLALAGALALFAEARTVWMAGLALFLLRALGQGAIGLGINVLTARWFQRLRGRTLAMISLGYPAGELIFPAIVLGLIGAVGWRGSAWTFAGVYALVAAPAMILLLRERRDDEPWDGGPVKTRDDSPETPYVEAESWTLRQALRSSAFWTMLAVSCVLPLVATAVLFHMVGLFDLKGWPRSWIPLAFGLFAVLATAATQVTGLAVERVPSRYAIAVGMALAVLALALVLMPGPPMLLCFAYMGVLGLSSGTVGAGNAILWPEYFGIRAHGAIRGVVTAFRNGSTALGPILFAALLGPDDARLMLAVGVLLAMCAASAVVAPFVRPPVLRGG